MGWHVGGHFISRVIILITSVTAKNAYMGKAPQHVSCPRIREYICRYNMHFPTNVDGIQGMDQRDTKYVVGNEVHGTI